MRPVCAVVVSVERAIRERRRKPFRGTGRADVRFEFVLDPFEPRRLCPELYFAEQATFDVLGVERAASGVGLSPDAGQCGAAHVLACGERAIG